MNNYLNHSQPHCRSRRCRSLPLIILAGMLLCCGWGVPAMATTPAEKKPAVTAPQPQPSQNIDDLRETPSIAVAAGKALGALAVVLGMLMLLVAALKKLGLSGQSPQGEGLIKVLETRMLAPKKFVAVLDIAGQIMAVGISEQQITLLTKLEPDEKLQALAQKRPSSSRFSSLLSRAVKDKNKTCQEDHA